MCQEWLYLLIGIQAKDVTILPGRVLKRLIAFVLYRRSFSGTLGSASYGFYRGGIEVSTRVSTACNLQ